MKYNYFTRDPLSGDNKEKICQEMIANGIITNEEYLEATKNPVIYHFVSPKKPWNTKNANDDIWWFYAQFTPFNNKELIKPMICSYPFENCEILSDGRVVFCCLDWIKQNSIGNIYEDSFEDIWNSPMARAIRHSVLDGSYSYCDRKTCEYTTRPAYLENSMPYPKTVKLSYDNECNLSCIICRQKPFKNTDDDLIRLNENIDNVLPTLKQANTIFLSGQGDPFASRHYRFLIKRIVQICPNIRFTLQTNGTLCNRKTLESLGIIDRINFINISLNAVTKEVWMKFTHGNAEQYDMLMQNINNLAEMQKDRTAKFFTFNFVVTAINYMELISFVQFAEKLSAKTYIWGVRPDDTELGIHNPTHKDHLKLKGILKNPIFDLPHVNLYPEIKKIRIEALA